MAEKGDVGSDTVSLPPTYAPSETYTESPPPAYRGKDKSKVVQIVRLVCITAVVIALLTGFFVLSSHYLKTRDCVCTGRPLDTEESRAFLQAGFLQPPPPPSTARLIGEKEVEGNTLDEGDEPVLGGGEEEKLTPDQVDQLVEEAVEAEQRLEEEMLEVVEKEEEALSDILSAQADHMKKIRLPVDLILGNQDVNGVMGGREVNCEVERRQVPLAPGVMSQTILVTCSDEDDTENQDQNEADQEIDENDNTDKFLDVPPPPMPPSPPRIPFSNIANIMKMLTSRMGPKARVIPLSIRPPGPMTPISMRSPMSPMPMSLVPPMSLPSKPRMSVRGPMSIIIPRTPMQQRETVRMMPKQLQPLLRIPQPLIRMGPKIPSDPREPPRPISLMGLHRGALPLPQASPRAPPRPVNLAPPRSRVFLPMHVRRTPTHMEMNSGPRPRPDQDPEDAPTTHDFPRAPMDFGPPLERTLISDLPIGKDSNRGPRVLTLPKAIRVHTLPQAFPSNLPPLPPLPNLPNLPPSKDSAPPPPRFAPGVRSSLIPPEVNPDAEVLPPPPPQNPQDQPPHRKHHLLMVN